MPVIKIERTKDYTNKARNYKIFIDKQQAGVIANGESKDFSVLPGQHTITAKIDWCSSRDVTVNISDSDSRTFKVGSFKNGNLIMPAGAVIVALHLILKMTLGIDYLIFLVIPFFILLMYYLTIGRKNYLTLNEV